MVVAYGNALMAVEPAGDSADAFKMLSLLDEMIDEGYRPGESTLNHMLAVLVRQGKVRNLLVRVPPF